jgi:uncharacterized membrane protein YphA (DoxX/SURF4 family)
MTKTNKIVYYILLVIVSALFLFSAYSKLSGDPMQVAGFATAHLPIWFMYFIGVAELAGAIGLWIPKLQKLANCGLKVIMVGAVVTTAIFVSVPLAIFPLVVGVVLYYISRLAKKNLANPVASAPAQAPTSVPKI